MDLCLLVHAVTLYFSSYFSFRLLCLFSPSINGQHSTFFLQVIQPKESCYRERLRSGKTILTPCQSSLLLCVKSSSLSLSRPSVPLFPSPRPIKHKKTVPQQTVKCLPPMCQVCFLSVAVSQLPKPTCLKRPPQCLADGVQVLRPGEESQAAL